MPLATTQTKGPNPIGPALSFPTCVQQLVWLVWRVRDDQGYFDLAATGGFPVLLDQGLRAVVVRLFGHPTKPLRACRDTRPLDYLLARCAAFLPAPPACLLAVRVLLSNFVVSVRCTNTLLIGFIASAISLMLLPSLPEFQDAVWVVL